MSLLVTTDPRTRPRPRSSMTVGHILTRLLSIRLSSPPFQNIQVHSLLVERNLHPGDFAGPGLRPRALWLSCIMGAIVDLRNVFTAFPEGILVRAQEPTSRPNLRNCLKLSTWKTMQDVDSRWPSVVIKHVHSRYLHQSDLLCSDALDVGDI